VVPATINHALVLEAESLIDDHLKEVGRARYIIDDDEFSRLDRWLAFFDKLADWEAPCVLRFGEPMDPFGNPVDDEGRSLAPDGRAIDVVDYVRRDGEVVLDPARDAAYTRALGEVLAQRYRRDTVVQPTWLVAHLLVRELVAATPGLDLFSRIRRRGQHAVPRERLLRALGAAIERLELLAAQGRLHLGPGVRAGAPADVLARVLGAWAGYHAKPIATPSERGLVLDDPPLLFYYQNRLVDWAQELADEPTQAAAFEIARLRERGRST
jgi:glycerol-3-phosphate O-acyltransferase